MDRWLAPKSLLLLVALAGLAALTLPAASDESMPAELPLALVDDEYRIQVGDELGIRFFYSPEFNEDVIVRPDGRISLSLVREVRVAGKTPAELNDHLTERYAVALADPEITVIVRDFGGRIFVGGEVNRTGEFSLRHPTTVIQAIWMAGGFRDTSKRKSVILMRHNPDAPPEILELRIDKALKAGDLSDDLRLRPFDVIYVPKKRIANINVFMKQYVEDFLPISFGIRLEKVLGLPE
jgi:polysaccharide export outer membrane protein